MKPLRLNKVLGIAVGERSLLVGEIVAGDRPEVKRLAEMVYPEGVSIQQPAALGEALGAFLRDNKFTARSAVFGLPARWLLVKAKEVPPADPVTLANLLRLQAEGEFSSELKDLVYDYAADTSAGHPRSVLLIATSKKYISAVDGICEAARLSAVMITSSAVALGMVTGRSVGVKNPLVLLVSSAGAELTAQSGVSSNAIRHLRGPGPDRPFVGELRRVISGMPAPSGGGANGTPREMVVWDAGGTGFDCDTLGASLGMAVRCGDLPNLGVDTTGASSNGEGRKFAAAVSLGLLALAEAPPAVDFLHSRLAPPKPPLVPHWVMVTAVAALAVIGLIAWAVISEQDLQADLATKLARNSGVSEKVKEADAFNTKVSIAQAWHIGTPRYLACLRDLTNAIPRDGQTYALSLTIHEIPPPQANSSQAPTSVAQQLAAVRALTGRLEGRTTEQPQVLQVLSNLKANSAVFSEVKLEGTSESGRAREVSFTITFTYSPAKPKK